MVTMHGGKKRYLPRISRSALHQIVFLLRARTGAFHPFTHRKSENRVTAILSAIYGTISSTPTYYVSTMSWVCTVSSGFLGDWKLSKGYTSATTRTSSMLSSPLNHIETRWLLSAKTWAQYLLRRS